MPPLWLFIVCTAGAVLHLFLFIALIAYRQKRSYEAVLSLLFFSLFLGYSARLLHLNATYYYGSQEFAPLSLRWLTFALSMIASFGVPALLVHAQISYARLVDGIHRSVARVLLIAMYLPIPVFAVAWLWERMLIAQGDVTRLMANLVVIAYIDIARYAWFWSAVLIAALLNFRLARIHRNDRRQYRFHFLVVLVLFTAIAASGLQEAWPALRSRFIVSFLPLLLSGVFAYEILRGPFLQIALPRNLKFAVLSGFGAVLYLTLASRISQWLEPWFPPVATISILVFVLVFLYEPLQRALSRGLQRLMREEVEKVQRVLTAVHNEARGGELARLLDFAETRIREEFTLEAARIVLRDGPPRPAVASGNVQRFPMQRTVGVTRWVARAGESSIMPGARPYESKRRDQAEEIGVLKAYFHGGMLSGETHAALETLAAQLPAAIDLCRAIEEKLTLERELAERERLALLGQMAASISHNLKNPLGSMKTLLQVQLENPELPEAARRDCQLVVGEVDRLAAKLNQLLRYAKPGLRESGVHDMRADASVVAAQVIDLLRRDAQQRGIALWLDRPPGEVPVRGSEEAFSDVLQNLVVNAIEATPPRGAVRVTLARDGARARITVSDEGPGIPADIQAKIFQPFFTTKPQGTGLGLAIVQRRLAEIGGTIECRSPAASGRGTEFVVTLPIAE